MKSSLRAISPAVSLLCPVAVACFLLLGGTQAWAQSTSSGTVSGQVVDPQSAIIAGAEVSLTDVETDSRQTTLTNEVGRYLFLNVHPGIYDLSVSKEGFKQTKVVGQKVAVGLELTLDVTLQIGSTTTSVEVKAAAGAELQTSSATVGSTISGESLMNLPNLGRDANAFFVLQPAITPGGGANGAIGGQVAGVVEDQSQFQLDGGNNSDDQQGSHNYNPAPGNMFGTGNALPSGVMPTPV
jgi:Carboxypeptidase regulatory-like domain